MYKLKPIEWIAIIAVAFMVMFAGFDAKGQGILELEHGLLLQPTVPPGKFKGWMLVKVGHELAMMPVYDVPKATVHESGLKNDEYPFAWWNYSIDSPLVVPLVCRPGPWGYLVPIPCLKLEPQ